MAESGLTQIIDYDGTVISDVAEWVEKNGLSKIGFGFSVVTVLGSQSSGKSTLLNALFGTEFVVMDSQKGHSQTTKGLWIGKDQKGGGGPNEPTIIVDVEGNDSRERGEDRLTFEYRAALFSLALADCVIVNMWYMSLGSYTASSYGLLKTVMEVNLELFLQQKNCPKTLLLFVVRDWSEAMTPLARMEEIIRMDYVNHIWATINKPSEFQHSRADDFFDFSVVGLPHAIMLPDEFDRAVTHCRKRWVEEYRPKMYSRGIPADGFGTYCAAVWDTIVNQSQLNIPTQKEMLATFRCQEIKAATLMQIYPMISDLMEEAKNHKMSNFQERAEAVFEAAIAKYNEPAARYEESIFQSIQQELIDQVRSELQNVADEAFAHIQKKLSSGFSAQLQEHFGAASAASPQKLSLSPPSCWSYFTPTCNRLTEEALTEFSTSTTDCEVVIHRKACESDIIHFACQADALRTSMLKDVERMREIQIGQLSAVLQRSAENALKGLEDLLTQKDYNKQNFHSTATKTCVLLKEELLTNFSSSWEGLNDDENKLFEDVCTLAIFAQLRKSIQQIVHNLHLVVVSRFETLFQYDDDDQPREWPCLSAEALKQLFTKAKSDALAIISDLKTIPVAPEALTKVAQILSHPDVTTPLISESKAASITQKAIRQMQTSCKNAQSIQANGGATSWRFVPSWLWLVLLALGWNEFWGMVGWLLRSPITFIVIVPSIIMLTIVVLTGRSSLLIATSKQTYFTVKSFILPVALKAAAASIQQMQSLTESTPAVKEKKNIQTDAPKKIAP